MVLGLPSLGTGLVETAGWLILSYAILRLGPEPERRKLEEGRQTLELENLHEACGLYEEVFAVGNLSVIDELLADDFIDYLHHCRGPQAFKRTVASLRKRLSDLGVSVEQGGEARRVPPGARGLEFGVSRLTTREEDTP